MGNFHNSTVYQIYVRSFADSNGDGVGDIKGITSKIPYLASLGIDYVWTTPFFVSPQNDNGYDVADYRAIDPRFGTMEDVEEMIAEAEKYGIGFMFDMVFNHTSTDHEWFQKALAGDPKYMDYYIWKDPVDGHEPTNWVSKFGGSAWEYVPSIGKYYLHLFDVSQADLNWENPEVREELKEVIRFWKTKGVKGFRFDVVNLISKPDVYEDDFIGDGRRFYTDGPRIHEYLKELVGDTGIENYVTVGEMSSTSLENCVRYANPDEKELSMVFSFHHLKVDYLNGQKWALKPADFVELRSLFKKWQEGMAEKNAWNALFWDNHDQPRAISRFGDDKNYWKESGKMIGALTHLMRGTPYVYEGEEIGITNTGFTSIEQYKDVESLNYYRILQEEGKTPEEALAIVNERSRDNGRTPMQWTGGYQAGFTTGTPWIEIPKNYTYINVEAEEQDEDSILAFYRRLIQLRKEKEIISEGSICFTDSGCDDIITYERELGGEKLAVFANLVGKERALGAAYEIPAGAEVLVQNYPDVETEKLTVLRPFEVVAYLK